MAEIAQPTDMQALLEAFTERAGAVAAYVTQVTSIEEVARKIASGELPTTSGRYTATSALLAALPELRAALEATGVQLRLAEEVADQNSASETARNLAGDIGLVLALAGVAETGSFLSAEETLPARLLGMLADSVIAFLPARSIVPTLDDAALLIAQLSSQGRRYISLVTGPSRTADIERVLTIGVQGPKSLHIMVLNPW